MKVYFTDLSPREQEVYRLLVDEIKPAEIASILNISRETVKTHIHRILSKLGLSSRAELRAGATPTPDAEPEPAPRRAEPVATWQPWRETINQ